MLKDPRKALHRPCGTRGVHLFEWRRTRGSGASCATRNLRRAACGAQPAARGVRRTTRGARSAPLNARRASRGARSALPITRRGPDRARRVAWLARRALGRVFAGFSRLLSFLARWAGVGCAFRVYDTNVSIRRIESESRLDSRRLTQDSTRGAKLDSRRLTRGST